MLVVADANAASAAAWKETLIAPTKLRTTERHIADGHLIVPLAARELQRRAADTLEPNGWEARRSEAEAVRAEFRRTCAWWRERGRERP